MLFLLLSPSCLWLPPACGCFVADLHFFPLQAFMEPFLKSRKMSVRQWVEEQKQPDAPLDKSAFCVLRNMLKVRGGDGMGVGGDGTGTQEKCRERHWESRGRSMRKREREE